MTDSQWIVEGDAVGLRLDKFLAAPDRCGSRARAASALERGKVYLNGAEVGIPEAGTRLADSDAVRLWMGRPGSAKRPPRAYDIGDLSIVYEDEVLLVINKPAGLLAVPLESKSEETSVLDQIEKNFRSRGKRPPLVVHRIDRDTSGLVVFAKNPRSQRALKEQFRHREPERVYWAVVYGQLDPPSGTWRNHLLWDRIALIQKESHAREPRAAEAISEYRVLEAFRGASLVEVRLQTGKRNQIRIQAQLRGHTLVGERRYVDPDEDPPLIEFSRQALHAYRLTFRHPIDDRPRTFEAPLPEDFTRLLERLRKAK